jgi:hypothetical protein
MVDGTSLSLLEAGQHRCFSVVKLGEMLLNAGMALYEKGLPQKLDAILIYCSSLNFPFKKNKNKNVGILRHSLYPPTVVSED